MKVRLRTAATVPHGDLAGGVWHPAGAEVEIPDEHFDSAVHEEIEEFEEVEEPVEPEPGEEHDPEKPPRTRKVTRKKKGKAR